MSTDRYQSPLSERYASREMQKIQCTSSGCIAACHLWQLSYKWRECTKMLYRYNCKIALYLIRKRWYLQL